MSRFKVNIHQLQEESAILKEKYDQYYMDQDSLYKVALTADGSWNDNSTPVFIHCVEQDSKKMDSFHDTFYKCLDSVSEFSTSLDKLLTANDIKDVKKNLTYDEDYCKKSVRLIESCVDELNSAKTKIEGNYVGCNAARAIQDVRANIISSINTLNGIENNITNIQEGIEDIVNMTSIAIKSYDSVKITDNELKYDWEPVSYVKDHRDVFERRRENDASTQATNLEVKENSPDKVASSATLQTGSKEMNVTSKDAILNETNSYSTSSTEFQTSATEVAKSSVADVSATTATLENSEPTEVVLPEANSYNSSVNSMNTDSHEVNINTNEDYQGTATNLVTDNVVITDTSRNDYELNGNALNNQKNISISSISRDDYSNSNAHLNNSANITFSSKTEEYSSSNASAVGAASSIGNLGGLKPESFETSSGGLQTSSSINLNLEKTEYSESSSNLNMNNSMNLSLEDSRSED